MSQLRVATFNVENLFSRYRLFGSGDQTHVQIVGIASIDYQGSPLSEATTQLQRNNTARAILDSQPDILALEEVENLWTLRCFNDEYLGGYFDQMHLVAGNDARGINVSLSVRAGCGAKIESIRTHIDDVDPKQTGAKRVNRFYNSARNELSVVNALFSRDCLEVDINFEGKPLTFLVNHFKSQDGSKAAEDLRTRQAAGVAEILKAVQTRGRFPIVLGDLNADTAINPTLRPLMSLVTDGALSDPFQQGGDSWTHFYDIAQETSRLDYILPDKSLAVTSATVLRKGISLKCAVAGERYPSIGYVGTEASDHCPVIVTLSL